MPEFIDVASYFDDTPAYDKYTGVYAFDGQFNTFEETSVDGSLRRKRAMSLHPSVVVPARKVIDVAGEGWLIGLGNLDVFQGEAIRKGYWLKSANDYATLLTPGELCTGAAGTELYIYREFLKFTTDGVVSADYFPFWEIFTTDAESPAQGKFFKVGDKLYRTRGVSFDPSGLLCSECDELAANSLVTVTVDTTTYDPINDEWLGTPTTLTGIILPMTKLYTKVTETDALFHAGDKTLLLPTAAVVSAGNSLTVGGVTYQILTITSELDALNLHLRLR
jgi:hypothetical protein